jgi:hypothetical protein
MPFHRHCLAAVLSFALSNFTPPATSSPAPPLGILTQAYQARVDEALAFPGLSFFEGEELSTDREGRIGARLGHSSLIFPETRKRRYSTSRMGSTWI